MKPEYKQLKKQVPNFVYYNHLRSSKLPKRNQYLIYSNDEVIIFRLLNYTPPLIPKLHGKMKQKLALLWSRINAKNQVFVVPYHISFQCIAVRCAVTVDYSHFSCRHNLRIVLPNQNACANELNIVLLRAFDDDVRGQHHTTT